MAAPRTCAACGAADAAWVLPQSGAAACGAACALACGPKGGGERPHSGEARRATGPYATGPDPSTARPPAAGAAPAAAGTILDLLQVSGLLDRVAPDPHASGVRGDDGRDTVSELVQESRSPDVASSDAARTLLAFHTAPVYFASSMPPYKWEDVAAELEERTKRTIAQYNRHIETSPGNEDTWFARLEWYYQALGADGGYTHVPAANEFCFTPGAKLLRDHESGMKLDASALEAVRAIAKRIGGLMDAASTAGTPMVVVYPATKDSSADELLQLLTGSMGATAGPSDVEMATMATAGPSADVKMPTVANFVAGSALCWLQRVLLSSRRQVFYTIKGQKDERAAPAQLKTLDKRYGASWACAKRMLAAADHALEMYEASRGAAAAAPLEARVTAADKLHYEWRPGSKSTLAENTRVDLWQMCFLNYMHLTELAVEEGVRPQTQVATQMVNLGEVRHSVAAVIHTSCKDINEYLNATKAGQLSPDQQLRFQRLRARMVLITPTTARKALWLSKSSILERVLRVHDDGPLRDAMSDQITDQDHNALRGAHFLLRWTPAPGTFKVEWRKLLAALERLLVHL